MPIWVYAGLGGAVLAVASAAYVSHLRDSLDKARLEAATATERATRYDTRREADGAALGGLLASTTRIQYVTKEVLREVPVLVPVDSCPLPPGWRVLHDAAAAGQAPAAPAGPDGPASAPAADPR